MKTCPGFGNAAAEKIGPANKRLVVECLSEESAKVIFWVGVKRGGEIGELESQERIAERSVLRKRGATWRLSRLVIRDLKPSLRAVVESGEEQRST